MSKKLQCIKYEKVLNDIWVNGSSTFYEVRGRLEVPHTSLHNLIKEAAEEGYLCVSKEEPFRTGLTKKYYELTENGARYLINSNAVFLNTESIQNLRSRGLFLNFFELLDKLQLNAMPNFMMRLMDSNYYNDFFNFNETQIMEIVDEAIIILFLNKELSSDQYLQRSFIDPITVFINPRLDGFEYEATKKVLKEVGEFLNFNLSARERVSRSMDRVITRLSDTLDMMKELRGVLIKKLV